MSNDGVGGLVMRCGRGLALLGVLVVVAFGVGSAPAGAQSSSPSPVRFADSALHGVEGRNPVQVIVERTDLPVSRLLVHFRTVDDGSAVAGTDYVHTAGTLVFEVGARSSSFFVTVRDDEVVEETEFLVVHLETSSGGVATARVSVLDDDVAPPAFSTPSAGASSSPPTSAPARTAVAAAPPTPTPPPVVVAASAGVRRPVVARSRVAAAARPAPARRIILQQTQTTPFELRPLPGSASSSGGTTAVDPVLALGAGLLLARVAAEVWFRARIIAAGWVAPDLAV